MITERKPSERFCVKLVNQLSYFLRGKNIGIVRARHIREFANRMYAPRREEGTTYLSPTMLESTLSRLRTSPSPRSTYSTSCCNAAPYILSRSRATIRCPVQDVECMHANSVSSMLTRYPHEHSASRVRRCADGEHDEE